MSLPTVWPINPQLPLPGARVDTSLRLMWLLVVSCAAVATVMGADYQVGDRPAADIVTPVQLVVVDHERTERLRDQEASRVPPIFFFNTNSAVEAELKMLTAYDAAKDGFLKAIERAYKKRKLEPEFVAQDRFGKVISTFQRQNRAFPLTTNLATLWALGEPDQGILEELATSLRETMLRYIRVDNLSPIARLGPQQVRLLKVGSTNFFTELDAALAESISFHKTNFTSLSRARKDLQATFGPETQWAAKFLSGFVRENCVCDEALTMQSRNRRTDPIIAADTYEAGRVVVKAGALIDAKMKAALDELAKRTEADTLKAQAAVDHQRAEAVAAQLRRAAADAASQKRAAEQRYFRVLSSVIVGAGIAVFAVFLIARRRPEQNLLPAPSEGSSLPAPPAEIRARLLPEFRRWLKRHFLQRLLQSNAALTETQRLAAQRVAELEQRLEEIKGPLQEKLKAYEQRITELECELQAKGAENRELLQATIKMARERLEAQRSRQGLAWN